MLLPRIVSAVVKVLRAYFDESYGGFDIEAKFPRGYTVEFALKLYAETGDEGMLEMATRTLDGMAKGGIHDQLGGGFHRYATDRRWIVPHFEKMDYVQAQLLVSYLHAYQATGNPFYKEVAEGIIRYVDEVLSDREHGGFYPHQDADMSRKDDGDYFTWTLAEARAVLSDEEAEVLLRYYDIREKGEMPENPAKNVLWVAMSQEKIAKQLKMPVETVKALIESGRQKLREARRGRKSPVVDTTIFSDRSGMVISAYLEAYKVLGREDVRDFALKSLDVLLRHAYQGGEGIAHAVSDGKPTIPGFLNDQVQVASSLLDAFEVTGEERYLAVAKEVMDFALGAFWDAKEGGFFDVREHPKVDYHLNPPAHAVIIGKRSDPSTVALWRAALGAFRPGKIVAAYDPTKAELAQLPSTVAGAARKGLEDGKPMAYVCVGSVCSLPTGDPLAVSSLVRSFGLKGF